MGEDRKGLACWGEIIADAYAADTRPPLPKEVRVELSQKLRAARRTERDQAAVADGRPGRDRSARACRFRTARW